MEVVKLNLEDILAVAWVWQCEIEPKYLELWCLYGIKCGCVRKPVLHVQAYRNFLNQICSNTPVDELEYTRGALSLFALYSGKLFSAFTAALKEDVQNKKYDSALLQLSERVPGRIRAAEQICNLPEKNIKAARQLIKNLLSVDDNGLSLYEFSDIGMTFTPRNQ